MSPPKTAEPIEMPVGWVTRLSPWNHVLDVGQDPARLRGNFGGLRSVVSHCCGVRSKKNNNGISATAAANCIASDWPVLH